MTQHKKNTIVVVRAVLVVFIVSAFLGSAYYILKDKRTCEAQGKVDDPTPGHRGCLEPCKRDKYRCVSSNCKHRWSAKTGLVCSDCDAGKIPQKEDTDTYKCVRECNKNDKCEDGETCTSLSDDANSPSYCASNLYTCTKDGNRGHYCTQVAPGAGGRPLNECLKTGYDGAPCSCDHEKGYALNNKNNACSTFACTPDGLKGWGSNQLKPEKNKYVDPVVDNSTGTCYALDKEGLLRNPNDDESKVCTNNTTQESCNNMNQEGWKCKWLPQVTCKQKPLDRDTLTKCCGDSCVDGVFNKWKPFKPIKHQDPVTYEEQCKLFQFYCAGSDGTAEIQCSSRGNYPAPPTNCLKDFTRSDDQIKYGDEILLSIDNTKANNGKLLKDAGLLFAYAKGPGINPACFKTGEDQKQTFIGKYQGDGESWLVSTNTVTFKIIPPTGVEPGTVLNTNDTFYLRSKYMDTGKAQPKYWYLTRGNCGTTIPLSMCPKLPAGEIGYVSISEVPTRSGGGIVATAFRFVDPTEDDKCGSNKKCDQTKNPLSYDTEYRLKNNETDPKTGVSTIPSYVGLQTCTELSIIKADSLVVYGNPTIKTSWYIRRPENILEAHCPNFFDDSGKPKSTDDIGGYNPAVDIIRGFHSNPLAQLYDDISVFAIILALLIVAILVFIIKKSHTS